MTDDEIVKAFAEIVTWSLRKEDIERLQHIADTCTIDFDDFNRGSSTLRYKGARAVDDED